MADRTFRFGIVAAQADSGKAWSHIAGQVEKLGYSTLLVPDTIHTLSPAAACAVAATATSTLRVGPYVLSAPNRTPGQMAYETATLAALTDGRYEFGIGAGRPGAERDAAALGMNFGSAAERIALVEETVAAVRARSPETRVLIAAGGPRLLGVAGRIADTVAFGLPAEAGEPELAAAVAAVQGGAGDRHGTVELSMNLLCVGDTAPPWLSQNLHADLADLIAGGSVSVVTGTTDEMAAQLQHRRDQFGISYICTNLAFARALAPVVQRLTGT